MLRNLPGRSMRKSLVFVLAAIVVLTFSVTSLAQFNAAVKKGEVVDFSLTVAMDLPGWWPVGGTIPYVIADYNKMGRSRPLLDPDPHLRFPYRHPLRFSAALHPDPRLRQQHL